MDGSKQTGMPENESTNANFAIEYPDLHVVFDFFADNPQKVMPGSTVSASLGGEIIISGGGVLRHDNPFYDPYWESIRLMQESQTFMEGMLLKSVDCKPAHFPYLHYIVYNEAMTLDTSKLDKRIVDPPVNGKITSQELSKQCMDIVKSQGSYNEMHTFITPRTPLLPKRPSNPNTAYAVSAFKTAGNLDSLDKTWTYWSGADYIVENIPKNLKLERVTFHKLKHGIEKDNFSYVLLCEIGEALADVNRAREFIDTLKYRQCGVTSMYVIDHFF